MFDNEQKNLEKEPYWGVFLNQARLNAYIALRDISERLEEETGIEGGLSEWAVLNYLDNDKDAVKSRRMFDMVEKHFPMLKVIYGGEKEGDLLKRSKGYREILACLFRALNFYRNQYCHAYPGTQVRKYNEKKLIKYLEDCFDASVRKIKELRSLDENDILHLRRKIAEGKDTDNRIIDNPQFRYPFKNEKGELDEKGLYFLTSIFLDKKDAHEFLKKQEYFKNDSEPKYRATLESFYRFRIKLPKPVIEPEVDENGLALDMLNELKKCPKELFDLISKEQQEEFRVTDSEDTDEDGNEILMRRYSDRFPYLALRYCDENQVFERIRFQIDLGRYYFKFYPKETIDGNTQQRSLDKRLKTFGRIKDVKSKIEQEWADIIKSPDEIEEGQNDPYKLKTTPHYNIVDNQIAFVISGDKGLPDVRRPDGKIELEKPHGWLSIYELPGLLFHGLKNGFEETEKLIKIYIEKQRSVCNKINENKDVPAEDEIFVPEALKGIEKGNTKDYSKKKLERMLQDTEQRIRAIQTTQKRMAEPGNKPGKKKFFDVRAGKLADFLARDIMALQRFDSAKNGKDKLTAVNFQVLQATLAFYGAKEDVIGDMFKEIGLLDGDNPHPFLKEIDPSQCHSIAGFYQAYLQRKQCYLENCRKEGRYDEQFLRPKRQRYAQEKREPKTVAGQLLDNPVNIPKNFFKKEIEAFVCDPDPSLKKSKMNTAYMIQAWFENNYGGQQPFYLYDRNYPVVSKAGEYIKKRQNTKIAELLRSIGAKLNYMEIKKIVNDIPDGVYDPENLKRNLYEGYKDCEKNERLIRRCKVEDMVSFMLVEETLKDQLAFDGNVLKLEKIIPWEDSPFQNPVLCHTIISVQFNTKEGHTDKDYVDCIKKNYEGSYRDTQNKIILKYKLTSEDTKLKDVGKYRRYAHDRRLPGLLIWKYRPNDQNGTLLIKYSDIEQEIKAYERYRIEIAQRLYILEKKVIESWFTKDELGEGHISFNMVIDRIKSELPDFEDKCKVLLKIRNAINHNQFPVYEDVIQDAQGNEMAEKMLRITESYVEQIMVNIDPDFERFEDAESSR